MVKPVNGMNPLVQQASRIKLGMPGDRDEDYEWQDQEWEEEPPEAMSTDEAEAAPRRRRRPPMPAVPKAEHGPDWAPPWPVDADGNAVGVELAHDGDAPGTDVPAGFDPPKGTAEAAARMMMPR